MIKTYKPSTVATTSIVNNFNKLILRYLRVLNVYVCTEYCNNKHRAVNFALVCEGNEFEFDHG